MKVKKRQYVAVTRIIIFDLFHRFLRIFMKELLILVQHINMMLVLRLMIQVINVEHQPGLTEYFGGGRNFLLIKQVGRSVMFFTIEKTMGCKNSRGRGVFNGSVLNAWDQGLWIELAVMLDLRLWAQVGLPR